MKVHFPSSCYIILHSNFIYSHMSWVGDEGKIIKSPIKYTIPVVGSPISLLLEYGEELSLRQIINWRVTRIG